MKDNSVKPGEYDISTDNKVTLEVKDNYSGAKLGDVIIKDVAKASDLKKNRMHVRLQTRISSIQLVLPVPVM